MVNIIHHIESSGTPSLLLSLDAEKAFDRVHWSYLRAVLTKLGFKDLIYNAILALYTVPTAKVYSADMLSQTFHITNGTRQGCPLSPLIFNMLIEPLTEHVRSNPLLTGVTIGKTSHKISLFADDVILVLTNPNSSLPEAQKLLDWFGRISYYKLNVTKSHILDKQHIVTAFS